MADKTTKVRITASDLYEEELEAFETTLPDDFSEADIKRACDKHYGSTNWTYANYEEVS